MPVVKAIQAALNNEQVLIAPASLITADAGYHSESNLKQLADLNVDALIADNGMRQRDECFAGQGKHKQNPEIWRSRAMCPLHDKSDHEKKAKKQATVYRPQDFHYDSATRTCVCVCPAGTLREVATSKTLYGNGSHCIIHGYVAVKFQGAQQDCVPCQQRDPCLRTPAKTKARQVSFFQGKADGTASFTDKMKAQIDSPKDGRDTDDASPRWNRYLATFATTNSSTASPSGGKRRSMRSGNFTAWCTTSRSWRITGMHSNNGADDAQHAHQTTP